MKRDLTYFLNKTIPDKTCMIWTGCVNTDGYPRVTWKKSNNGKLHRIVWELYNQKDPTNYVVRHTCDNPRCINPEHLILGSFKENNQDRTNRDRSQGLKQKDVELIQTLYTQKIYTVKELMRMFNVSSSTIYYTLKYRKRGT